MSTTDKTPLWLDLKKEYIDDNLDKLQVYLKDGANDKKKQDSFYSTTVQLLRLRVEDLVNTLAKLPIYERETDPQKLLFNIKLLAIYLLTDKTENKLATSAYLALMSELQQLKPKFSDYFIKASMQCLKHEKIATLGFNWSELNEITDVFALKAAQVTQFDTPLKKPRSFTLNGTAILTSQGLRLTADTKETAKKLLKEGSSSAETEIGVAMLTPSADKISLKDGKDLVKIAEFTKDFIYEQHACNAPKPAARLKTYFEDKEVTVRITQIDEKGVMHVETTDPAYDKLTGVIKFGKVGIVTYQPEVIHKYFQAGDYLKATITKAGKTATFSIYKQLIDFFIHDTERVIKEEGNQFLAKLILDTANNYVWINGYGIAMYTKKDGEHNIDDIVYLEMSHYGKDKHYGMINATIMDEIPEDDLCENEVRKECIRAFVDECTPADVRNKANDDTTALEPVVMELLLRQMFEHQRTLLKPLERYRYLANANVMAEMIGDTVTASFLNFAGTYLNALVRFVRNEDFKSIVLTPDEAFENAEDTRIRLQAIELLKEYGNRESASKLSDAIDENKEKAPMLARLARLIQISNFMQETLSPAALNVIRREIIKTLSIETEDKADLESDGAIYLGLESNTQEFKTSIVIPPDSQMQADERRQNLNVMKGICAFLNSTIGGTLYLGVNDQGYVTGIKKDMKILGQKSIDSFTRYIQDTAKRYFGTDAIAYLTIEPLYDDMVVAIHVKPHPYRIVELEKEAYIRINAESRKMPEQMRQELIDRKMFTQKDKAAATSRLLHACEQKVCVILHQYASSNSGKVTDREIEAYDVRPTDGLVIGYDREKNDVRVFSLNRIGYVEILEKTPWEHSAQFQKLDVDVFHMTGDKPIPVSLQLNLMAKNLLVEEYPAAKEYITNDKNDHDVWYFNGDVYQLKGIGRFYMGLANCIKILKGDELKQYVADYSREYLSGK